MKDDLETGFATILKAIERRYPGELVITPPEIMYAAPDRYGHRKIAGQIGSIESNLDRASGFLIGKVMREDDPMHAHQLYVMIDKISAMRSWRMMPRLLNGGSWLDHYHRWPERKAPYSRMVHMRKIFAKAALGVVRRMAPYRPKPVVS